MATAYAAVTCLMNLITQLDEHPNPPIQLDEEQVDSLNSKISFFQGFLEKHHTAIDGKLEVRIADAAHAAEDLIETHIADRIIDFHERLQRAIEGLDLIVKQVREINWIELSQHSSQSRWHLSSSSQPPSAASGENFVVGIEGITIEIVDMITYRSDLPGPRIISIIGMAGIGKTTLAREVYNHPYIKQYFETSACAVISKNYTRRDTLIELLGVFLGLNEERLSDQSESVGIILYKYLLGKRYLVVLDDVWDVEAWERLVPFFPDGKGSMILITTRESKVAALNSHRFAMDPLDERKSWDLFCAKVFGQADSCPLDLEDVGKNIVEKCRGLPLSIVVVGGHLAGKSQIRREDWEYVANNLSSVVNSIDNGHCLKILSKSYDSLAVHLKPCFLYMAVFPEDAEIKVSRLISLWVAEGFLKPIDGKSLEEAAKDYLNDLIGRSLILPSRPSKTGGIRRCKIHDLLRDFCIKEAAEKKFLYIAQKVDDLRAVKNERRVVRCHMESQEGYSSSYYNASRSEALRTFIFDGELSSLKDRKLLRVLAPVNGSSSFLLEILDTDQLVNIRYFDPSIPIFQDVCLPSSIFSLWNLQYLFINIGIDRAVPLEIWKMPQLRVVNVKELTLAYPSSDNEAIHKNLKSAKTIINFSFCSEAVERIPNIKKLKVRYDLELEGFDEGVFTLNNIDRLQKLESFKFFLAPRNVKSFRNILENVSFPHSLRELSFSHLHWEDVTAKIGSLPLLKVLKLCHCEGTEWDLDKEQFFALRVLQLSYCRSLELIKADNTNFPCLESLVLERLDSLEEIPSGIKDRQMLSSIALLRCPDSVVVSAKNMADELSYIFRNKQLQVKVWLVEESTLSVSLANTRNFHLHYSEYGNFL